MTPRKILSRNQYLKHYDSIRKRNTKFAQNNFEYRLWSGAEINVEVIRDGKPLKLKAIIGDICYE